MATPSARNDPLALTSPRLEVLKEQGAQLGARREAWHKDWQQTLTTLRTLYDDLRTRDSEEYMAKLTHRHALEAERATLDAERIALRRERTEELESLGAPLKQRLKAKYLSALAAYVRALQAALTAQQQVQAIVEEGATLLPTSHGLPSVHADPRLQAHLAAIVRYLGQEDQRYA